MVKSSNTVMNIDTLGDLLIDFPVDIQVSFHTLNSLENISNQILNLLFSDAFGVGSYPLLNEKYVNSKVSDPIRSFHYLTRIFIKTLELYGIHNNVDTYKILKVKDIVKDMWYKDSPILTLLKTFEKNIISTIRKCNLAIIFLSLLGCMEFKLEDLQEDFLDIFAPNTVFDESVFNANEQLLRTQWLLFLDLKTRIYVNRLQSIRHQKIRNERINNSNINPVFQNENESTEKGLDEEEHVNGDENIIRFDDISEDEKAQLLENDIFSNAFLNELVLRRTSNSADPKMATSFERVFVQRYITRKGNLMLYSSLSKLEKENSIDNFLDKLKSYSNKNISLLIWGTKHRHSENPLHTTTNQDYDEQILLATNAQLLINVMPFKTIFVGNEIEVKVPNKRRKIVPTHSAEQEEAIEPELAKDTNIIQNNEQDILPNDNISEEIPVNTPAPLSNNDVFNTELSVMENLQQQTSEISTAPTVIKKDPGIKLTKTKSKWTQIEEDALIAGLKAFGPSWAKILDYHGPGGKFSEDLKNRTQVQLKDKARNWKIQFLRNGHPLPQYLVKVTGNLTRGRRKRTSVASTPDLQSQTSVNDNVDDQIAQADIFDSNGSSNPASSFDPNL